jgi:hypothetical protein
LIGAAVGYAKETYSAAILQHQPELKAYQDNLRPGVFKPLFFVGPAGSRACDTEYFQKEVRGSSSRKPNDLVVKMANGAATRLHPSMPS